MAAPSTPANLVVTQANGQVYLEWDLSAGATTYSVQRSTDQLTYSTLATPAVTNYLDTTVALNTQYWYKVAAVSSGGTSIYTVPQDIIPTMTGLESLAALRLQAQYKADMQNSQFVTKAEWNTYINKSYQELYDLLVTTFEDYYLAAPFVFQTTGADSYTLPNGIITDANGTVGPAFYKLMGVDMGLEANNNARVSVNKFDFAERNRYVYPNVTSTYMGVFNLRYRVLGSKIHFIPNPQAGQYITLWYIPRISLLLKDTDVADGVSGWTEYVVVDAAIKALQKQEMDVTVLMAEKQMLLDRIESTAMNRDAGQPDTITKIRGAWGGGGYGGPGWDGSFGGY